MGEMRRQSARSEGVPQYVEVSCGLGSGRAGRSRRDVGTQPCRLRRFRLGRSVSWRLGLADHAGTRSTLPADVLARRSRSSEPRTHDRQEDRPFSCSRVTASAPSCATESSRARHSLLGRPLNSSPELVLVFRCRPALGSARTRSSPPSAPAGWASCMGRAIRALGATSRSRSFFQACSLLPGSRTFQTRGARRLSAQSSEHLHGLRCRRVAGSPTVHRHGTAGGRDASRATQARGDVSPGSDRHGNCCRRCPRRRAQGRRRPPRPQAREHLPDIIVVVMPTR
jgi:hypothetical protein